MTAAQQRALDELLPKYGIAFGQPIRSERPLVLEIGSGMGETTAAIAAARSEVDFVAVEVHGPGVGSLLNRIEADGLKNLRVVRHDAVEVLNEMVADESLAAIHLFFPDPWPKKRHYKRRLVREETASLMARKLAPGGILHAATDWPDYAEHMSAVLGAEPLLELAARGFAERPTTKFESRGQRLGHPICDLYFQRRRKAPAGR
jgi:tRNA (guanine-N7-)-methyltransferase